MTHHDCQPQGFPRLRPSTCSHTCVHFPPRVEVTLPQQKAWEKVNDGFVNAILVPHAREYVVLNLRSFTRILLYVVAVVCVCFHTVVRTTKTRYTDNIEYKLIVREYVLVRVRKYGLLNNLKDGRQNIHKWSPTHQRVETYKKLKGHENLTSSEGHVNRLECFLRD